MFDKPNERGRFFSDREVQGALLVRLCGHWLAFLVMAAGLLVFVDLLTGEPREVLANSWVRHAPLVLVVGVLLPIFLRDVCRLSHRFAGPMVRLRQGMRDLAEGRRVPPMRFREGDFWQDLAVDFNRVADRLRQADPEFDSTIDSNIDDEPDTATGTDRASRSLAATAAD